MIRTVAVIIKGLEFSMQDNPSLKSLSVLQCFVLLVQYLLFEKQQHFLFAFCFVNFVNCFKTSVVKVYRYDGRGHKFFISPMRIFPDVGLFLLAGFKRKQTNTRNYLFLVP